MAVDISTTELISIINRTRLPTVVVEGADDIIAYRQIESDLRDHMVSVLPAGGREKVLEIFNRRSEISSSKSISFIVDQDLWVFRGIPDKYSDNLLVVTDGYSIENDLLRDFDFFDFMTDSEKESFFAELDKYLSWYALAVGRCCDEQEGAALKIHPEHLFKPETYQSMCALTEGESFPTELRETIRNEFLRFVRGKSLVQLFCRSLSYNGRAVRYNHRQLIDIAARSRGNHLNAIFERVRGVLLQPHA